MASSTKPCDPWVTTDDLCCDCEADGIDPDQLDRAIWTATRIAWALSGRQFGVCRATIRPCRDNCCNGSLGGGFSWPWASFWTLPSIPVRSGGAWTNCWGGADCGGCNDCCSVRCEIDLPKGPACGIEQIRLDGEILPDTAYRIDDWRHLVALERPVAVSGGFVVDGNVARLGQLEMTGWDFVNPSDWPVVLWPNDTVSVVGGEGDTVTVLTGPDDEVSWPAGWTAELDGSGGTIVGNTYTAGPNPPNAQGRVKLTLTAGNLGGDIVGVQNNPGTTGFSTVLGTSTGTEEFCWPTCQDMDLPATEEGTFEITYCYGVPVPEAAIIGVAEYACELAKLCSGAKCKLPQRVTSLSRQGTSLELFDPLDFLNEGRTGIVTLDQWIRSENPNGLAAPPGIFRADQLFDSCGRRRSHGRTRNTGVDCP